VERIENSHSHAMLTAFGTFSFCLFIHVKHRLREESFKAADKPSFATGAGLRDIKNGSYMRLFSIGCKGSGNVMKSMAAISMELIKI
jgi:hypothetical protein